MFILLLIPLSILAVILKFLLPPKKADIKGKHVVVIGGSSGIGKSVANLAAQKGANVTIIARNVDKLSKAKEEICKNTTSEEQIITQVSMDVVNYEVVEKHLSEIEETVGPIFMLINCAGLAICGKVEEMSEQDIRTLIEVNFLGSLYPVKAIIPKFKKRKEGILVLTASQVALMGMYGYSVYSSMKFALRGLAESVYMEAKPYNISVTLALPPDTDTPGFENENKSKPEETKLLSETGGLMQPEVVAEKLLNDALIGKFFSYVGFESSILTTLCVGMTPFSSLLDVVIESILLGFLRLMSAYYITHFHNIIKRCHVDKEEKKEK